MIDLAHALGLAAVAEGAETAEEPTRLGDMGADLVQGDIFSCPLPADEATAFLESMAGRSEDVEVLKRWTLA